MHEYSFVDENGVPQQLGVSDEFDGEIDATGFILDALRDLDARLKLIEDEMTCRE